MAARRKFLKGLREVGSIEVLAPKADEILVLTSEHQLSAADAERIRRGWDRFLDAHPNLPRLPLFVLDGGLKLQVIRRPEQQP